MAGLALALLLVLVLPVPPVLVLDRVLGLLRGLGLGLVLVLALALTLALALALALVPVLVLALPPQAAFQAALFQALRSPPRARRELRVEAATTAAGLVRRPRCTGATAATWSTKRHLILGELGT